MSRTTSCIKRINNTLSRVSGLDGVAANKLEALEDYVEKVVDDILSNNHNSYCNTIFCNLCVDSDQCTVCKNKEIAKDKWLKLEK